MDTEEKTPKTDEVTKVVEAKPEAAKTATAPAATTAAAPAKAPVQAKAEEAKVETKPEAKAEEKVEEAPKVEATEKTPEQLEAEEFEVLKARADIMGIGYSNNIGVETLRKKISDKLNGEAASNGADDAEQTQEEVDELIQDNLKAQVRVDPADPKAGDQTVRSALAPKFKDKRQEMHDEYMRLIRCRITNMDPKKKDLQGEIFTVANEMLGTVKKFIPYGEFSDNGYHIPYWLFLEILDRRFLNIRTSKDKASGQIKVQTGWAKEFAIEVLPPLTQEELDNLATAQLAAGSVERETFEA